VAEINKMDSDREKYNKKLQLELLISKIEVDIENLVAKYKENKRILSDIEANKAAIENNNKIETSLNNLKVTIDAEQKYSDGLKNSIDEDNSTIKLNTKTIEDNKKIIAKIEEEEKTVRSWKLYLDLIGKNGISKIVLRTVLPLINGELKHLLSDVCDFDVEIAIDNHNDVAFYLIHDGVKSNLSSGSGFEQTVASLALRSVLSKISTFSKPSFVVFDEILGGVAEENYDSVKKLYDKIVNDQGLVLQITHLKTIADWHQKTITVTKKNNISSIKTC
jgi:DNA repair exonuclease SbcCD ATPase subunit